MILWTGLRVSPAELALLEKHLGNQRWRLNNLYSVLNKEGEKLPFRLNVNQRRLLDDMHTLNVVLKARQLGFTTFIDLFLLDACLFNSNVRAGIIAHNLDDAKVIFRDKVKFAYDNLPDCIKEVRPMQQDSAASLVFANNSSIRVGTSHRSGTLQYLHISEYGKICAEFPDKAREIRSGALNTVSPGNIVFIESTAEGYEGDFYDICRRAEDLKYQRADLTPLDYKFHFFPWWEEATYTMEPTGVAIPATLAKYFAEMEAKEKIALTPGQRAWYAKKAEEQKEDMKREYPATSAEAFEQSIEGAYFSTEMMRVRQDGRLGHYPFDARYPVNTFWDIGINDTTNIWLHQRIGTLDRFIGYYFNNGEALPHYLNWLTEWKSARGALWGKHYLPHDVKERNWGTGETPIQVAARLNYRFEAVPRVKDKLIAINQARLRLASCCFDEAACAEGVKHLDAYRKEWNDLLGVWRDKPRHDDASHGADAFMTFATGYADAPSVTAGDRYRRAPAPKAGGSWMAA